MGVVGLGFMGATHVRAYQSAAKAGFDCALVAVADQREDRRAGKLGDSTGNYETGGASGRAFDPSRVRQYERADELIADADVDLVSICTPTDSHVALAAAALRAGKHVLVEKPVSLHAAEIRDLDEVARQSRRICMPAMCMRFWPGWDWLKGRIEDRAYGACVSARFERLGAPPTWAPEFYGDGRRSGGAIVDLHVHDADFVRYCFGKPDAVTSAGRVGDSGAVDHVTTMYRYTHGNGPAHVVAEGGWLSPGFPFTMRYVAVFERAAASFDFGRDRQLMLARDGTTQPVAIDLSVSGYEAEVSHMLGAISSGRSSADVTLADAAEVMDMIDAERRSIERRESVRL